MFRKIGDGLFLDGCREIAAKYPQIKFNDMIIDNASMQVCCIMNNIHTIIFHVLKI